MVEGYIIPSFFLTYFIHFAIFYSLQLFFFFFFFFFIQAVNTWYVSDNCPSTIFKTSNIMVGYVTSDEPTSSMTVTQIL